VRGALARVESVVMMMMNNDEFKFHCFDFLQICWTTSRTTSILFLSFLKTIR